MPRKIDKALIAGVTAGFVDPIILQPLAARAGLNISDDVVRVLAGFVVPQFFGRRGKLGGIINDVAQAEAVIGSFNLGQQFAAGSGIGGFLSGGGGNNGGISTL